MSRVNNAVTVGTTPTKLTVAPDINGGLHAVTYYNAGAVDVWIGGQGVTVNNGIRLAAGGTAWESIPGEEAWAVVATGTCKVNVDQVGV